MGEKKKKWEKKKKGDEMKEERGRDPFWKNCNLKVLCVWKNKERRYRKGRYRKDVLEFQTRFS